MTKTFPIRCPANHRIGSVCEVSDEDPQTGELRSVQNEREQAERRRAHDAPSEEDTQTHQRRADKAEYLKDKLRERGEAESKTNRDG